MSAQLFGTIFANAAIFQKSVLAVLVLAILVAPILAILARSGRGVWRRLLCDLRLAAPALGLLVGAITSLHMALTIEKLPFDVTARQLAPGVLEVSTLIALGALAGLVALAALVLVDAMPDRRQGA